MVNPVHEQDLPTDKILNTLNNISASSTDVVSVGRHALLQCQKCLTMWCDQAFIFAIDLDLRIYTIIQKYSMLRQCSW